MKKRHTEKLDVKKNRKWGICEAQHVTWVADFKTLVYHNCNSIYKNYRFQLKNTTNPTLYN